MKKKIILFLLVAVISITLVGCGTNKTNTNNTNDAQESEKMAKSNCSYYKCLNEIKLDNTVDEITKIIGINPETDESGTKYTYKFSQDKNIVVNTMEDGKVVTVILDGYDEEDLANKKVTLDNLDEVDSKINDGITYEQFKKYVGGLEGTLVELGSWNKYIWVAEDGDSNVTASFSSSDKLMFFNGIGF